jgi:hypothetical protein
MTAIVADTHAIIWYLQDAQRLSEQATLALKCSSGRGSFRLSRRFKLSGSVMRSHA